MMILGSLSMKKDTWYPTVLHFQQDNKMYDTVEVNISMVEGRKSN